MNPYIILHLKADMEKAYKIAQEKLTAHKTCAKKLKIGQKQAKNAQQNTKPF